MPTTSLEAPRHSTRFRVRRILNWFPLGLAYAFLYMARYNLTVAKNALGDHLTKADFGDIFGIGAVVYGCAFVINGPLTDKIGGRKTMLIGVIGSMLMNVLMGLVLLGASRGTVTISIATAFTFLYALNMYFQSFGAVAIVTVNAPWFHVRERGTFSTIFGTMISLGIYFAFDWGSSIVEATRGTLSENMGPVGKIVHAVFGFGGRGQDENWWTFFVPAIVLGAIWMVLFLFLKDTPKDAGFEEFETGTESVSKAGERLPVWMIFWKIVSHPVLLVVCGIAFSSGVMKNGILNWYPIFAKETGIPNDFFITHNWGLILLLAGIAGATLSGWVSDRFFQSRRAPMSGIMYGILLLSSIIMCFSLAADPWIIGLSACCASMCIIGVHGIMAGTSTVDFGGARNAGSAVGIVDGLVYLGTGLQSFTAGKLLPHGSDAADPTKWMAWPAFLVPFAVIGLLLSLRIWNALPGKSRNAKVEKTEGADAPEANKAAA